MGLAVPCRGHAIRRLEVSACRGTN